MKPESIDTMRARFEAHRVVHSAEHDPANGRLHGCCLVCGVPWPCAYVGQPPAAPTASSGCHGCGQPMGFCTCGAVIPPRASATGACERCDVCGWTLAESRDKGCVRGDCSYRPQEGSDEWHRIRARRAELAAPPPVAAMTVEQEAEALRREWHGRDEETEWIAVATLARTFRAQHGVPAVTEPLFDIARPLISAKWNARAPFDVALSYPDRDAAELARASAMSLHEHVRKIDSGASVVVDRALTFDPLTHEVVERGYLTRLDKACDAERRERQRLEVKLAEAEADAAFWRKSHANDAGALAAKLSAAERERDSTISEAKRWKAAHDSIKTENARLRAAPAGVQVVDVEKAAPALVAFVRRESEEETVLDVDDVLAILRKHTKDADVESVAKALERMPVTRGEHWWNDAARAALRSLGMREAVAFRVDREKVAKAIARRVIGWPASTASAPLADAAIAEHERQLAEHNSKHDGVAQPVKHLRQGSRVGGPADVDPQAKECAGSSPAPVTISAPSAPPAKWTEEQRTQANKVVSAWMRGNGSPDDDLDLACAAIAAVAPSFIPPIQVPRGYLVPSPLAQTHGVALGCKAADEQWTKALTAVGLKVTT